MDKLLELARSKDPKDRATGVELLLSLLQSSTGPLSSSDVESLVSTCLDLLNDPSNLNASLGAFQCLASAAVLSPDHLKLHFDGVLPAIVECLGDDKQPLRDAARGLLLTFMEVSSPTIIVDKVWPITRVHNSSRVHEEFMRIVTSAITAFTSTEFMKAILPPILQMLKDSTQSIREGAIQCIEEMYMQFGSEFLAELQQNDLPSSVLGDINIRLQQIEPKVFSFNGLVSSSSDQVDCSKVNQAESNPKKKDSFKEISVSGGEIDFTDKLVVPVTLNSEKELIREMEKIACMLAAENDWSVRIAAMQRVEALVIGGAVGYPCFHALLKQLVVPLCTQLSDRRSSIVKQACHLLCFLSKELLGDFEACSEMFIPVLFKLVVITVLIIAESADTCIKTMLRNCKVSRVLPQIINRAKHDCNAVLRARCCEYSLLMLEYWVDAPEIQRSADLYEDLIKCCIADAMSEVRSNARRCYKMFKKTWPERSQQLFLSFDSVIQKMINDEDGTMQKRHPSPSVRVRDVRKSHKAFQAPSATNLPGPVTSTVTRVDRNRAVPVGFPLSAGPFLSEVKSHRNGTERSFENMQHANKQRVPAIENTLAGLNISEKHGYQKKRSDSLDLGVDLPSSSGLPFSPIVTSSAVPANAIFTEATASTFKACLLSKSGKQASEKLGGGFMEEHSDDRFAWKSVDKHIDKQYVETSSKDANFRDNQGNIIPNFQRPLLRKNISSRVSGNSRSFLEDNQILLGEMSNYVDGPTSLQEALTEGLSPNSNWSARVAAFNYVQSLLQQDQKGVQEVAQNFEKVMKLFFQHLNDPHHKVAQAALSALADVIPACRKPFEGYLDRILYHVFSRLIDPKELVRQLSVMNLEVVSKAYGIDSLLPALLRALDEQRSPKVKLAVIEYAISSFKKNAMNSDGAANSGILKLWIAKLIPLIYDKNTKLKETAISCIVSIHTHYDSIGVINYIMCMSAEEQTSLRRILRKQTPRIEMDLINFSQNKRERPRPRNSHEPSDVPSPDGEYAGALKKTYYFGRYSSGLNDIDNGKKFSVQEPVQVLESIAQKVTIEAEKSLNQILDGGSSNAFICTTTGADENVESPVSHPDGVDYENAMNDYWPSSCFDMNMITSSNHSLEDPSSTNIRSSLKSRIIIPQILHQISDNEESATIRQQGLKQLMEASTDSNHSIWAKHFNQILKVVIEVLDDPDSSTREFTLQLVADMVNKQKDAMEDSIELVIEKLLHIAKDAVSKVSTEAEKCLSTILSEYDPLKCISVIVALLITEDDKALIFCIKTLTKIVHRLSQEQLLAQLPSFLPVLFCAFQNQSAEVRKTVVFCLVDIYIMLGKAFRPYLRDLNGTQLRLVTLYANRISQARSGTCVEASNLPAV